MTRFLMTLDQAVDTVFEALANAAPGEVVIPSAPSAHVMDIARALIGDRGIEIRITGMRPGEKEHEILVSDEECRHTRARGGYYAIAPMLPELTARTAHERRRRSARSTVRRTRPRATADTAALLRENRLMLDQVDLVATELLR